jgi:alpha-galactosidase
MRFTTLLTLMGIAAFTVEGRAMTFEDIPAVAPSDAVMASPDEVRALAQWAMTVFTGQANPENAPPVALEVKRQDFSSLRFRQSCMSTPMVIGKQPFAHGLGTHANSEIVVQVPAGAVRFEAFAGIDNNYDTGGMHGSVEFSVEVSGKELLRTPVLRGGHEPCPIAVDLPADADAIVLKVDTTPDGPAYDQSDWADARFVFPDGRAVWLDEGYDTPALSDSTAPFSFQYGGKPSEEFLNEWARAVESEEHNDFTAHRVTWSDAATGLRVTAEAKIFKTYPSVDWVLFFKNEGTTDTPIIQDLQALDLRLDAGGDKAPVTIGHNKGDVFGEGSFENGNTPLDAGKAFLMTPLGGRSSNGAFPFFDVRFGTTTLIAAVGWSGQWAVSAERDKSGPVRLRAGMEQTHLVLHPGEQIRSPRILLMANQANATTAHNRFRRLMMFHYVPQKDGRPIAVPVSLQCFDRYSWNVPEWATEAGQIDAANQAAALGLDTHWFDAAWFVGGFPNGVGNWYPKPEAFPRGLRPVADACHAKGIQFLLWFEPERVAPDTQISKEHPDFVFGGGKGGLFRLDLPEARRWLTDLLSQRIEEYALDVYRNDFNIDPLSFWRGNDAPDRQGMTEIRYIEGLYAMWDELLEQHPGLVIDDCASGGRRIDLEMCMRSIPLWRSDTNCFPGNADWNPGHSVGISYYLPLHAACAWAAAPYEVRAATTAGLICQWPYLDKDFPADRARALVEEAKSLQKYWYGDLYALTTGMIGPEQWCAFQLHRPDLGEGIVMCFRRIKSPYTGIRVALSALDADKTYVVERTDDDGETGSEDMSGKQLMDAFDITLPAPAKSLVVRYREK